MEPEELKKPQEGESFYDIDKEIGEEIAKWVNQNHSLDSNVRDGVGRALQKHANKRTGCLIAVFSLIPQLFQK